MSKNKNNIDINGAVRVEPIRVGSVRVGIDGQGGDNSPDMIIEALKRIEIERGAKNSVESNEGAQERDADKLDLNSWNGVEFIVFCYPENEKKFESIGCVSKVIVCEKEQENARVTSTMDALINYAKDENNQLDACVSAGNTGMYMALSYKRFGMSDFIKRPALVSVMPSNPRDKVFLDLGANLQYTERDLVGFAIMGAVYAKHVLGYAKPKVSLLNIGSEDFKGPSQIRQAREICEKLAAKNVGFECTGFIEGDEIFHADTDVVVTDGFTGNVLLKFAEGLSRFFFSSIKAATKLSWRHKIAGLFTKFLVKSTSKLDPSNHNSATMMGLKKFVVKGHGNSSAKSFYSTIKYASRLAQKHELMTKEIDVLMEKSNEFFE